VQDAENDVGRPSIEECLEQMRTPPTIPLASIFDRYASGPTFAV